MTSDHDRRAEAPQYPGVDALQIRLVLLLEIGLHGGQQRGHRHPGQDDRRRRRPARRGGADHVGQGHRAHRAGEGGEREDLADVGARAVDDDDGGPEARSGRHPQQIGVGQRVAEHPLVGRAAPGQHGADHAAEDDPGQADLPDHVPVDGRGVRVVVDQREWLSRAENTVGREMSAGPTETPTSTAPIRAPRATSTGRRADIRGSWIRACAGSAWPACRARPSHRRARRLRLGLGRQPPAPGRGWSCSPDHPWACCFERVGHRAQQIDDARPPARGDVVVEADHLPVLDRGEHCPPGPFGHLLGRSARSRWCRPGRCSRGWP